MKYLDRGYKVVSDNGKKSFLVDSLISRGTGQANIYLVREEKSRDLYALKLFYPGNEKAHRAQIARLKRRGRASAAFVHPLYSVTVDGMIGYVMEYVGGDEYMNGSVLFNGIKRVLSDGSIIRAELPLNEKLAILHNVVSAITIMFEAGIVIADVKPENFLIHKDDLTVKILDVDTATSEDSRPVVKGTVGFMEPLVMRGEKLPDRYSDAYAIAVIIWMTLISGHPLLGRRFDEPVSQDIYTYTYATNPVFVYNRKDASNRPPDSDKRVIERVKKYPSYFLDAMHKTFVDGLFDGRKRTTPREWLDIFERLYEDHFICKSCGEEHFYETHTGICHLCGAPIEAPLKMASDAPGSRDVHLFNAMEIFSSELFGEENSYPVFRVVVSDYDKKYGLTCLSAQCVTLTLANGFTKTFTRGDVIPIFMDSTLQIGKYKIKYTGGKAI